MCDCYTNYQITTPMPDYLFGDSFGYDMQKDIGNHMSDYYAGMMSNDELDEYFSACCTEMRKYQVQCHRSSGNVDEDNRKIISQVYEIFAKENARAARRANYDEGAKINESYGYRNYDWVFYNADYYYQRADVKELLGNMANKMARKWGIVADEAVEPSSNFKLFYKEDVDNVSKIEMWINGCRYGKDIPFYITPDSLKGQLLQADDITKEYEEKIGNVKGYSDFMNQISLFTGWYAWSTGINNRFGNIPEDTHWKYG